MSLFLLLMSGVNGIGPTCAYALLFFFNGRLNKDFEHFRLLYVSYIPSLLSAFPFSLARWTHQFPRNDRFRIGTRVEC